MSGIALFLQSAPNALKIVRLLGAIYLGYLGIKMLFEEFRENHKEAQVIPKHRAFLAGFTTNLLNPKATVFMLSLFSQFADSYSTWNMKIAFGLCIPLIAISWFSLLSCLLTHPTFLPHLQANKRRFTILMSGVLILLGAFGLLTTFTA
jgi:threonine/homoserine/homoserine lactone efflux protein